MLTYFVITAALALMPPADGQIPVVTTYYNPADGDINCNDDCSTIATGKLEEWHYGAVAACSHQWIYKTIVLKGNGGDTAEYQCLDTGGKIRYTWSYYYKSPVVYVDIMAKNDSDICNYCLYNEWELTTNE